MIFDLHDAHALFSNHCLYNPLFVQTVQSKAEAALSVRCLTKSTVPKSFIPPDVVQTPQTWIISRWVFLYTYPEGPFTTLPNNLDAANLPWGANATIRYNKFICYCKLAANTYVFYYGPKANRRSRAIAWIPVENPSANRIYKCAFEIPVAYSPWFNSSDTQTIIDGKGSTEMDVWSSVTIWTGDTLSAPLSNNQSTSKYELSVCNDYEMLY